MTGATITAVFDDAALTGGLKRPARLGAEPAPLMKRIGVGLVKTTQERFRQEQDAQGTPWVGLLPAYAEFKKGPGWGWVNCGPSKVCCVRPCFT